MDLNSNYQSFGVSHRGELTTSKATHKYMFSPVKAEHVGTSFSSNNGALLPSTSLTEMSDIMPYDHVIDMNNNTEHSMDSNPPLGPSPYYTEASLPLQLTSFIMAPTHSFPGLGMADNAPSWLCNNDKLVRKVYYKCDYPSCDKAFRRNEHLKRHKQTLHGEGPNRFSCEFCGKSQFNRQDNLNSHRKRHARPKSGKRGVEFIPAAIRVIEQEERARKRQGRSSWSVNS